MGNNEVKSDREGNIKEFINLTDDEMNEIAYFIVKTGAKINTLDELAKEVEKHVRSEEGIKFLYFTLGRIEAFETITHIATNNEQMNLDEIIMLYTDFINELKVGAMEYLIKWWKNGKGRKNEG